MWGFFAWCFWGSLGLWLWDWYTVLESETMRFTISLTGTENSGTVSSHCTKTTSQKINLQRSAVKTRYSEQRKGVYTVFTPIQSFLALGSCEIFPDVGSRTRTTGSLGLYEVEWSTIIPSCSRTTAAGAQTSPRLGRWMYMTNTDHSSNIPAT